MIAAIEVSNKTKPLPVSKKSVVSSKKMLFTNIILRTFLGQVIISQYTDETASGKTHSAFSRRGSGD